MTALSTLKKRLNCKRCRFSHRTARHIRWVGAKKIQCKDDINVSLVDGRVEGRIGVLQVERVESEVVLSCEENNNEGACDMLCSM